jgi:ABC-2 type transport system permease protein
MNSRWFRILSKLFVAEAKGLLRDRRSTFFTIAMPLIFLVAFGAIGKAQNQTAGSSVFPGNTQAQYFSYVMPSLLAIGMVNLSLFGTTLTLASAREKGLLRHYMLIPLPLSALLTAQVSVRLIMALFQGALVLSTAMLVFDVSVQGNFFELFFLYLFCAAALLTCGYALAGVVKSFSSANALVNVLNLYAMAFGQIFTNFKDTPGVKWLIYTTPVSAVSDLMRHVCLGQWVNLSIGADLAILSGWMLIAYVIGIRKFHFLPE